MALPKGKYLVSDIESELSEIIADTEEADQSEPSSEE